MSEAKQRDMKPLEDGFDAFWADVLNTNQGLPPAVMDAQKTPIRYAYLSGWMDADMHREDAAKGTQCEQPETDCTCEVCEDQT